MFDSVVRYVTLFSESVSEEKGCTHMCNPQSDVGLKILNNVYDISPNPDCPAVSA